MRFRTFFKMFCALKYVFVFVFLSSFACAVIEMWHQEFERFSAAEKLNKQIFDGSNSSLPEFKLWLNRTTNEFKVVQNYASSNFGTLITMEYPKPVKKFGFKVQLTQQLRWSHDVTGDARILMEESADGRSFFVLDNYLQLRFDFNNSIKISSFVLQLHNDVTGRPTNFSYKVGDVWIEHTISEDSGLIQEFMLPDKISQREVTFICCALKNLNKTVEYLTVRKFGIYRPID